MKKLSYCFSLVLVLMYTGIAGAQNYPVVDAVANKVIQRYEQSSCEQLWRQKSKPKTAQQEEFLQVLRNDPQRRAEFFNKVSPTILNKMFECGMIP